MNDNFDRLYAFVVDLGFEVHKHERLESFDNYIIEGCSKYFCLRGISDRLVESLEVRSLQEPDNWYDMNIIMASIDHPDKLREVLSLDVQMQFVESHLDELAALFDADNITASKIKFRELMKLRAKLAFPRWFES